MAGEKAYRPFAPGRRPGGKPPAKPKFRVLVHHQFLDRWNGLVDAVGLESAQQFYDHVSQNPGPIPAVNTSGILRGKAARPREDGFSRTVHYEICGAGRLPYQWNGTYSGGHNGAPPPAVWIHTTARPSHDPALLSRPPQP